MCLLKHLIMARHLARGRIRPDSIPSTCGEFSKGSAMEYVLIIHEVESYPEWKAIFDRAAQMRKNAGEISYQLLRFDTDANNVVHFSRWSSLPAARSFFESPELVEIRERAGVKTPEFIYLQELEHRTL